MTLVRRLLFTLFLACLLPLPALAQDDTTPVATNAASEVRVMSFNIWMGGEQVDLGQVIAAIRDSGADVVGLQEAEGRTREIADALGWEYADERMQIISRLPLIAPPGSDGLYTFVQVRPGAVFAMANVHLPSDPYGPEAIRDGETAEDVLQLEAETRLPVLQTVLDRLPELEDAGIPVVMTGDFNTPSSLDWTSATATAREQVAYPLIWPVSEAAFAAGLQDTFRTVYPDPVERPGLTWTPGYPAPTLRPDETLDRIDWVLASESITVLDSQVVGESDNSDVDIAVMPYPSDHRGVVSTLEMTPATPPVLIAVDSRRVTQGDPFTVRFHAPGEDGELIGIVPAGADVAEAIMSLPPRESFVDGSETFGAATLAAGDYDAVLIGADGAELSRAPFSVVAPGTLPTLTVAEERIPAGEPIDVAWQNAPGNKFDWIAIYGAGDPDLYDYWAYLYTGGELSGSVTFDDESIGGPLDPGDYEVRLLRDDGYVVLATAPFTVTAAP